MLNSKQGLHDRSKLMQSIKHRCPTSIQKVVSPPVRVNNMQAKQREGGNVLFKFLKDPEKVFKEYRKQSNRLMPLNKN